MLTAESSGSLLPNVMPLDSGATDTNSCGAGGVRRQLDRSAAGASRNHRCFRKGRQYSVKTFRSLVAVLFLSVVACKEKPIDQGALITARTIGLEHLQRGRLAEARWTGQGFGVNAHAPGAVLRRPPFRLPRKATAELGRQLDHGLLSARGYDRVLRVAWSIVDIDGRSAPDGGDIAEALQLRTGAA